MNNTTLGYSSLDEQKQSPQELEDIERSEREMGRSPCCSKEGMNKGAWTAFEDKTLSHYIKLHGEGKWRNLPKRAGLKRCGKSCRLRWLNYLRPDIKRGNITSDEEDLIIRLHKLLGNRWSLIAGRLPGRTDNEIKNYWNTNITKKLKDNPSSSSNPTLTKSPSKQTLSSKIQRSRSIHHLSSEEESRAIRTKASRCTRILYDHCVLEGTTTLNEEKLQSEVAVGLSPLDDVDGSPFLWKDPEPSDFLMDFDLDDKFLCDFLNTEVFDTTNTSSSSPNSEETLLFPSEVPPFLNCSLDWPQYQ